MTPEEQLKKLKSSARMVYCRWDGDDSKKWVTPVIENDDILEALRECRIAALEEVVAATAVLATSDDGWSDYWTGWCNCVEETVEIFRKLKEGDTSEDPEK